MRIGRPSGRFFYCLKTGGKCFGLMKTKTNIDERILALAEPIAEDMGLNIVRVRVMAGKRRTVQIMAERKSDGQIHVDQCANLSRELSAILEVEDPIAEAYMLEVGSPGLDRPLTSLEDFTKYEGYLARIELDRLVEGRKRFRGVLAGVEDGHVDINLDGETDSTASIPFDWISESKLLITDELIEAGQKAKAAAEKAAQDNSTAEEGDT
jgi:ribosome maturation factor RimP